MLPRNHPDRIRIAFDDHRLVANAGLILPATLALRLGLPQLLRKDLDLGGAPGRANTGDKMPIIRRPPGGPPRKPSGPHHLPKIPPPKQYPTLCPQYPGARLFGVGHGCSSVMGLFPVLAAIDETKGV